MQQHSSKTWIVLYINISYLHGKILIIMWTCYDISYAHWKTSDIVAFVCKYANYHSVKLIEQLNCLLSVIRSLTEDKYLMQTDIISPQMIWIIEIQYWWHFARMKILTLFKIIVYNSYATKTYYRRNNHWFQILNIQRYN